MLLDVLPNRKSLFVITLKTPRQESCLPLRNISPSTSLNYIKVISKVPFISVLGVFSQAKVRMTEVAYF